MHPAEVVCVGLATADTLVTVAAWPDPDGRAAADRIDRAGGGPAATAAVALSRLGRRVSLVAAVGRDTAADVIRGELETQGVALDHLRTQEGRTAESVIVIDRSRHTRAILHAAGVRLDELDEPARRACAGAKWVHADHAGARLLDSVDPGRRSLDAGHLDRMPDLRGIGLYAPSRESLQEHTGLADPLSGLGRALAGGAVRVAVTLGQEGALAADASGAWHARPPRVDVVSTLGAGDVFHGALLAGIVEGGTLPDALRRATVAATLACRAIDGRSAIPNRDELDAAMASAPEVEPITLEGDR